MLHLEKIVFQAFSYEYITQLDENVDVKTLFIALNLGIFFPSFFFLSPEIRVINFVPIKIQKILKI